MTKQDIVYVSSLGKTWIFDLDGTLVKHNGFRSDEGDVLLLGAKEFLDNISEEDSVIFLTARSEEYREITEDFLANNNIKYDHIVFGLPYGERILFNDRKPGGLETAISVNTERDVFTKTKFIVDSNK